MYKQGLLSFGDSEADLATSLQWQYTNLKMLKNKILDRIALEKDLELYEEISKA